MGSFPDEMDDIQLEWLEPYLEGLDSHIGRESGASLVDCLQRKHQNDRYAGRSGGDEPSDADADPGPTARNPGLSEQRTADGDVLITGQHQ